MALRQELSSDLRYALWLGFQWNLDYFKSPGNKLMLDLDFEELCQENRMRSLPNAQAALTKAQVFVQSVPEDQRYLLDPITDHFAYLKTWGYKMAFYDSFHLADNLLSRLVPAGVVDTKLAVRLEHKLYDSFGVATD